MTAPTNLDRDVIPIRSGRRVHRDDGTARTVLRRPSDHGWAVFDGTSSDRDRTPALGYSGSWHRNLDDAIEWARTEGLGAS